MSRLRVASFSLSIDGYAAGPDQSLQHPLGVGGMALHDWAFATRTFQRKVLGQSGGEAGLDDDFAARSFDHVGAWILGRNMFGPVRGPWLDESWRGWWGDSPVYQAPVFVVTHHARAPLKMQGGTTFYFVTEGIHAALEQARRAAGGLDVRVGGGAGLIRQYLQAGLIDEMHLAIAPVLLGAGERLFDGTNLAALGYRCSEHVASARATHIVLRRDPT